MSGCKFGGKDYSEGSLICLNGRELKCSGGEWKETGYRCNAGCAAESDQIPENANIPFDEKVVATPPHIAREFTVYAEFFSIWKDGIYLYFKGAPTVGHVCSNSPLVRDYKVPLPDVLEIGPQVQCPGAGARGWYRKIRFEWPD